MKTIDRAAVHAWLDDYLDALERFRQGASNHPRGEAANELAGQWTEFTIGIGVNDVFTHIFAAEGRNNGDDDARPEDAAKAFNHAGPAAPFRGMAALLLRFGEGWLPTYSARQLAMECELIAERKWPPRVRALLKDAPNYIGSHGGLKGLLEATIGAAIYKAATFGPKRKSWQDIHAEILPADAAGYPTDGARGDWYEDINKKFRDSHRAAGDARFRVRDGDIADPELADIERRDREVLARDPAEMRKLFDQLMAETKAKP